MRAGYTVVNYGYDIAIFIVVGNYPGHQNLIANYGYGSEERFKIDINTFDIGFWRIKRKETIKAK